MLHYRIHALHICSLFYTCLIFLYYIYIMRTRGRRMKRRTVKNKRRKSYKRRGGYWDPNESISKGISSYTMDAAPYTVAK